jgi:rhodanese-related sulfurtransferase
VLGQPAVLAVDVREPDEYAYEHIVGTQSLPLNRLMDSLSTLPKEMDIYVLCQTGIRTQQAIGMLRSQGFTRVHGVAGGVDAWKTAGFAVRRAAGPIPIMRQVQIAAGSLALIGGLVPGVHWIAAVVGAGLVFAGVSGTCGMALLLAHMPWNKITPTKQAVSKSCGGPSA